MTKALSRSTSCLPRNARRILSLWLPRAMAERAQRRRTRQESAATDRPLAILAEDRGALRVVSLNVAAERAGLSLGQSAADARAILPEVITEMADASTRLALSAALLRWAQRFCPWAAEDRSDETPPFASQNAGVRGMAETGFRGDMSLALDVSGSAHLFGGEPTLLQRMTEELEALGFSVRAAIAENRGAAWAMARYGAQNSAAVIVPPGGARAALSPLPPEALRLEPKAVQGLARLGIADIETLAGLPRGAVSRRFGPGTLRRLDQAFGSEPEPIAPAAAAAPYAARLSLPEPIGLLDDLTAALDRLLLRLCARLEKEGLGARRLTLELRRVDRAALRCEAALARPSRDPHSIARLFSRSLDGLDAGFGIDALRLEAIWVERLAPRQTSAADGLTSQQPGNEPDALAALLTTLGGRVGFDNMTRFAPTSSHPPDRAAQRLAAAYAGPSPDWRAAATARPPRPLSAFAPEPVAALSAAPPSGPPARFRWRGAVHTLAVAAGPERIAPEWWLDDPAWRSGVRDYWRVETEGGLRLWLFETPEAQQNAPRWFAAGRFA